MDVRRLERVADWSSLASTLAGRDTSVRFEAIKTDRCVLGRHFKLRGKSIIQISPERVDDDDFLGVFLHEVAHAKLHFPGLHDWPSMQHKQLNGQRLRALGPQPLTAKHQEQEDEADALAARWLGWCKSTDHLFIKVLTLSTVATVEPLLDS